MRRYLLNFFFIISVAGLGASACSSSSNNGTGTGGKSGTGGAGGATGTGGAGGVPGTGGAGGVPGTGGGGGSTVASCSGIGGAPAQSTCLLNAPTSGGVAVTRPQPTYTSKSCP